MTEGNGLSIPSPDASGSESDPIAHQEEKNWSRYDDLSKAKHRNVMLVHTTIGYLIPVALVLAFLGFSILAVIYLLHLVIPEHYRWLKPEELQNIHSIVFSGVAGGAIAMLARTYFADKEGRDD